LERIFLFKKVRGSVDEEGEYGGEYEDGILGGLDYIMV